MKKYIVVAWHKRYPLPELDNIQLITDSYDEAQEFCNWLVSKSAINGPKFDWAKVIYSEDFEPDKYHYNMWLDYKNK